MYKRQFHERCSRRPEIDGQKYPSGIGSLEYYRSLPPGSNGCVLSLIHIWYIWMYAGQRNERAAMVGKYLSWTPNSGSHSISTHTTLAGSWTVPEDGFYLVYLPFVNAFSSVIQWPAASAAIPA